MDNYDIMKMKTYHNYDFDKIESNEFLELFYKFIKIDKIQSNSQNDQISDMELDIPELNNRFDKQSKPVPPSTSPELNSDMELDIHELDDLLDKQSKPVQTSTIHELNSEMELEKNEINNINEKQSKNTERAESSVLNSKKIKNKSDFLNEKSLQDQILSLEFTILPFIQKNSNSIELIKEIFKKHDFFFRKLIDILRKIYPTSDYVGQNYYAKYKKQLQLPDELFPIFNTGNGNCLYNSISLILFGEEKYFFIIKLCSIFVLIDREIVFNNLLKLLKYGYSLSTFIKKTSRENEFGNEVNIYSISILLNREIISYNASLNKEWNNRVIFFFEKNELEPILIGLAEIHFFPILKKKNFITYSSNISNRDQVFFIN